MKVPAWFLALAAAAVLVAIDHGPAIERRARTWWRARPRLSPSSIRHLGGF